jgi:hypothetical protein
VYPRGKHLKGSSLTRKQEQKRLQRLAKNEHSSLFVPLVNFDRFKILSSGSQTPVFLSCKIFEHFALQVDPVIEFIQLGSTPFKDSATLEPKRSGGKATPPPLNLDPVCLIRIDSHVKLFKDVY